MSARPSPPEPSRAGSSPPAEPRYEFPDPAKESFRSLATSVSFVGVCTMLFGLLGCVFVAGTLYAGFGLYAAAIGVSTALCLVTSLWMVSAGRSLSALVRTRGRDIEDLMEAVAQFRRLFGLARVVIVVLAMAAVAGCALFVWCSFVLDRGGKCLNPWG